MTSSVPSFIVPNSKIAIVGEAPGADEVRMGRPFVGKAGQELRSILASAGIELGLCSQLNVFAERPEGNNIENFCLSKKEVGKDYPYPPLRLGKYFDPARLYNLSRLAGELSDLRPNLVLALGNTACWALLGNSGISKLRGTTAESTLVPGLKVLPTFHPAAVLRQWELRVITCVDAAKAKRESEFPEIIRPEREITIDPSLEDIEQFYQEHLAHAAQISFDIETGHGQIKCIGFAPSTTRALVIPFIDQRKQGYSFWQTEEEELAAWEWVKKILSLPCPKIAQNGLYDIQWLWRKVGIAPAGEIHDTMLLHHALQPELEKGLGFLGSIYTNESSWKLLRNRSDDTKRDDE